MVKRNLIRDLNELEELLHTNKIAPALYLISVMKATKYYDGEDEGK